MVGSQPARQAVQTRYREVCPLASGGMAELSLARMSGVGGFERLVVIKRVKPQLAGAPDLAQALLDEARIAATLQHGNIVQVHDVNFEDGLVSVVMEFLHGQDVRTVMRRAGAHGSEPILPLDQAISVAVGVCAGLHHAHERVDAQGNPLEIVHRDVSADNVFVTYDGGVKLIDFGIARAHSRLGQTDHGVTKGKPGYMAPEQILCTRIDRRTDVHAAAVLLYEMTCGIQPRTGASSDYELLNWTVERDATPPSAVRPGYPPALEAIVMRGLQREPEARFQSALEMQRALEEFAREHKLDLSNFAVARVMEDLFRDKLEAWRAAQKAGTSLADHVAAVRKSTVVHGGDEMRAALPQHAVTELKARPPRRRSALAYALLGVIAVAAIGIGVWRATAGEEAPAAPVASEPPPAPPVATEPPPAQPAPPTVVDTAAADPEPPVVDLPDEPVEVADPAPAPAPAPDRAGKKRSTSRRDATRRSAIRHSTKGGKPAVNDSTAKDTNVKDAEPTVTPPPVTKPPVTKPPVASPPVDPDGSLPR